MEFLADHWPATLAASGILIALLYVLTQILARRELPYDKRPSLLTQSELAFYNVLRDVVGGDWSINVMVRLADLIKVRDNTQKYQSWQNRIQAKHIDFVLSQHDNMEAKLAIELDDRSHQRADRIRRDEFVDAALDAAGVPLLRVTVKKKYAEKKLRKAIEQQINGS